MLLLALREVSDKIPTAGEVLALGAVAGAICLVACAATRWSALLVVPFGLVVLQAMRTDFITEGYFYEAVVREQGPGYIAWMWCAGSLPLVGGTIGWFWPRRRARATEAGCDRS